MARVERLTPDLADYPELVVVYLGMRVRRLVGVKTILGLGPRIDRSWRDRPDGLLRHENLLWSLWPPHLGMRQYWRDLDSLERWTRSAPHRDWWLDFMRDTGGTGFWHEAYFMRGGIDAIYEEVGTEVGLGAFAPLRPARGPLFSARTRARAAGEPAPPVVSEAELYATDPSSDPSAAGG